LGRLLNVFDKLPIPVRAAAENFVRLMEAEKAAPGPFCSELVHIVFTALADVLPTKDADPVTVAPDYYAASDDFRRLKDDECPITVTRNLSDLPGIPCDAGFVAQITKMLVGEVLRLQEFQGKIIQINAQLTKLVPWLNGTDVDIERERYAKLAIETRAKWLKQIEEFLWIGCDSLGTGSRLRMNAESLAPQSELQGATRCFGRRRRIRAALRSSSGSPRAGSYGKCRVTGTATRVVTCESVFAQEARGSRYGLITCTISTPRGIGTMSC
jgi:hypothetical protein